MNKNLIDDIEYFLRKGDIKSYQRAQLLLDAAVEEKYFEEKKFNILEDRL